MLKKIKVILKRLLNLKSETQRLIESGMIVIGKNCNINGLNVVVKFKMQKVFLKINDNCVVSGNFVFERADSYIEIGSNTFIGGGMFVASDKITIGNDVMFSWGCTVIDTDAHSINWNERKSDVSDWKKGLDEGREGYYKDWTLVKSKQVVIGDKSWIGFNSVILKGVKLGEECVVGAGSVVTKSFESSSVIGGNPAKIIK